MENFDHLDIEGRNPPLLSEEEREKVKIEEHDRKRLMRSSVTAEDGTLRPVYSETEDGDIWCHICNVALFGAHKLISHNTCNRHKIKLDEWPYPVLLWSKRSDIAKVVAPDKGPPIGDSLAPGEPVPPGMEDQLTRSTTIQKSLDRHQSSPLVGLEYLLELVDSDSCEPSYTCVLCDKRGDPRTVMAHITSYNHRITYLNRHFPTISRAITDLPRLLNYKRGANEISVLVAKKIEERFGRLQPQLVDKNQFEKNKMQYIKRVYQDYHFRETPELTFMEVYDVRWVTNFEEKMAEMSGAAKKDSLCEERKEDKYHKEGKNLDNSASKKSENKMDTTKSGFKIRILTRDKLNFRKPLDKSEDTTIKSPKRPSDETKSLSSLSSISSSPSPSRSRSRSPHRIRRSPISRSSRYRGRSRYSHSISRSRSRSLEPLKERDKWEKYREQIRRAEETLDRALKFHEKNPEKHPAYPDEWKKFWNRRYKELQADGKDPSKHDFKPEWIEFWNKRMREIHNEQLQQRKEEIRKRLELPEDKPQEKWIPPSKRERLSPKRNRHRPESDDDVEYVGTKMIKTDYYDRHDPRDRDYMYPSYSRGRGRVYSNYYARAPPRTRPIYHATPYPVKDKSPSPTIKTEDVLGEDLEIVGLLRLLTALEGQLGSLGPKIVSLLSKALAAEKAKPNSAEELLFDEEVSVLFETVKEKLKGQLFAGMIEKVAIPPTKTAIQNIAQLLHKSSETKKKLEEEKKKNNEILEAARTVVFGNRLLYSRPVDILPPVVKSDPVSVPGIGTVDKVAIAQQIAAALVAQGRANVSQEELETLINAVVGMAEASKNTEKPVTTADFVKGLAGNNSTVIPAVGVSALPTPPLLTTPVTDTIENQTARMERLSDADLKTHLQNFKNLTTQEQHGLINFLKKLEATDAARVEKLRAYVNLSPALPGSTISSSSPNRSESVAKIRRSNSPFSVRKGIQNPTDDDEKWKPKLDMFADDDEEEERKKKEDEEKSRAKLELSDDDDDYTFEDIYKAANKNVSESEKAKKKARSYSKSPKSWSRSSSRSRSRSPARTKDFSTTTDPNAILSETKRLIANIMGDLPNKYVPKSHLKQFDLKNSSPPGSVNNSQSIEPLAPPGLQNFYNQNYSQTTPQPIDSISSGTHRGNQSSMPYPNVTNQPYQTYHPQQQMFGGNPGYVDNGYGYQGYGNHPSYGNPPHVPPNSYHHQQDYGQSQFGGMPAAHPGAYSQQMPPQQYGNYTQPPQQQQQRFY